MENTVNEFDEVKHKWNRHNDRWVYIEYLDDTIVGLNFMQGDDYTAFKENWCESDPKLTAFHSKITEYTEDITLQDILWLYHDIREIFKI